MGVQKLFKSPPSISISSNADTLVLEIVFEDSNTSQTTMDSAEDTDEEEDGAESDGSSENEDDSGEDEEEEDDEDEDDEDEEDEEEDDDEDEEDDDDGQEDFLDGTFNDADDFGPDTYGDDDGLIIEFEAASVDEPTTTPIQPPPHSTPGVAAPFWFTHEEPGMLAIANDNEFFVWYIEYV